MKVICDKCGGEMTMSWTNKVYENETYEEETHIKFTCQKCGNAEYLT